ncbi:MAG TPA: FAD-binding oxidoreductase [Phycisphaerales bacterium]|nr:FAD-binding oxidoreductase [Phycisphaerales bacterium]
MNVTRRDFIRSSAALAGGMILSGCATRSRSAERPTDRLVPELVNDVHSQLNPTTVAGVLHPRDEGDLIGIVQRTARERGSLSVCGGRHAAGGQQFLTDRVLIDLDSMRTEPRFDPQRGLITLRAGARWPEVFDEIDRANGRHGTNWAIHQKQGGGDQLTLGGAVASNIHNRCLDAKPFVADVESLRLIGADGRARTISRERDRDLFMLAIGGYGLFGVVSEVTLRLVPRKKLRLSAIRCRGNAVLPTHEELKKRGATHGDWQFAIDPTSDGFLDDGILTSYAPVADSELVTRGAFNPAALVDLAVLAHAQPGKAYEVFAESWKQCDGWVEYCDRWQTSDYVPDYHALVDQRIGATVKGSETLAEFYVPLARLTEFLSRAAASLRQTSAKQVYGVVRLVRRDDETFLNWAREDQACVILNLHVDHTPKGIDAVNRQLRAVAQIAVEFGGRFYLTYGRFATREQLLAGYPQLPEFLSLKRRHDPREVFQSNWYAWLKTTVA